MMQQVIGQDQLSQQQTMVQTQQQFQNQPQLVQQQILQQNMLQQPQLVQQQQLLQQQMQQQQLIQGQQQIVQAQPQQILQGQQIVQQQQNVQGQQQMLPQQQQMLQGQQIVQQMLQPQLGQQMLYCPTVRLVYDTSMLMQQGDQMQQQNQNIFVNQPPWARPVQNQVIYVQQLGPNLVPVQNFDPNVYLQQNMPMYQQVVQNVPQLVQNLQPTVQNVQQVRPMVNNMTGLVQNFNNMQNLPEQNVGQVQNVTFVQSNQPTASNQEVSNTNNNNNEAERQNTQMNQQNQPNPELNQMYRQIVNQTNHPQIRPMIQMTNQIPNVQMVQQIGTQNVGTNVRQVIANVPPNVPNIRPNTATHTQTVPNSMNIQNSNQNVRNSNAQPMTSIAGNVQNVQQVRHVMPNQINYTPRNITNGLMQSNAPAGGLNTVTYSVVRNGHPYTYKAIQPKQPTSNVRMNYTPRAQAPMVRKPVPNVAQNNVNNVNNSNNMNNVNSMNNSSNVNMNQSVPVSTGFIKTEVENPMFNRKRKSESPDEVQKKVSNYGSVTVTAQVKDKIKAKYGVHTSEIGINTSPIHKPKSESNHPLLQINPMEARIKQEVVRPPEILNMVPPVQSMQTHVPVKKEAVVEPSVKKDVSQQTEEKLVRKTVFPQATTRGRLLDDKVNLASKIEDNMPNIPPHVPVNSDVKMTEVAPVKVEEKPIKLEALKSLPMLPTKNEIMPKEPTIEPKVERFYMTNKLHNTFENMKHNTTQPLEIKTELKKETVTKSEIKDVETRTEEKSILERALLNPKQDSTKSSEGLEMKNKDAKKNTDFDKIMNDNKSEKTGSETKNETAENSKAEEKAEYKNINDISGKEIHMVQGNVVKEEKSKDYILTHVLDGYVIQESNVPFAIRRPLKEKPVNTVLEDKDKDPNMKNLTKEEMKDKILELSQLHLEDSGSSSSREKKEEGTSEKEPEAMDTEEVENIEVKDPVLENPFKDLKQNVVKTWTVEDLTSHLSKHGWTDTVTLLQEHEIDGESLFLVTRTQLVTIGVSEGHAELICEFVGSKS